MLKHKKPLSPVNGNKYWDRPDCELSEREKLYGVTGSPIPGSRMLRGYCDSCGEPIRVFQPYAENKCTKCSHELRHSLPASKDDTSPWQENVVRDMEDNPSPFPGADRLLIEDVILTRLVAER